MRRARGRERFPRCRSHFDEQRRYPRHDKDIQAKLEEIKDAELNNYVETLLGTAKTLADDGDLPGAVNVLQDATRSDKRIDAQIATYKNQYKQKNSRCCRKASR